MDALSRLLMLNAPQGTIDKNCVLGSDWQLPHGAGELSVIRWHALTQGAAKLEMPTGEIFTLRPGNVVLLPQNSAHRLSHVDNESTCIVCGTLRLQHSARYFLTSLPETLFLAPVNHSVEYNWLREAIPFLQQESRSRCREWMHCVARSALHSLPSRCVSGLHRLIQRKTFSVCFCIHVLVR